MSFVARVVFGRCGGGDGGQGKGEGGGGGGGGGGGRVEESGGIGVRNGAAGQAEAGEEVHVFLVVQYLTKASSFEGFFWPHGARRPSSSVPEWKDEGTRGGIKMHEFCRRLEGRGAGGQ